MNPLTALSRIVRYEEPAEIRAYVIQNRFNLAEEFGTTESQLTDAIASIPDDSLARKLSATIKLASKNRREAKAATRDAAAQASADVLATMAAWDGDRAEIDVVSVLASCLTRADDYLVFAGETFTVAIPMGRLIEVARLERADLSGWVDANGLHIRWTTDGRKGGFNFLPTTGQSKPICGPPNAPWTPQEVAAFVSTLGGCVTLHLPAMPGAERIAA